MEPDTTSSKPYHVSEIAKHGNKQVGTFKNIYNDWTSFIFLCFMHQFISQKRKIFPECKILVILISNFNFIF